MEPAMGSWYEIEPRPAAVGEGWRLHLYERDPETGGAIEVGGGVFPVEAYLKNQQGSKELASKAAYADAMENAQEWMDSRLMVEPE